MINYSIVMRPVKTNLFEINQAKAVSRRLRSRAKLRMRRMCHL